MKPLLLACLVVTTLAPALTSPVEAQVVVSGEARASVQVNAGGTINQPRRYRRRPGPRLMAPLKIDLGGLMAGSDVGTLGGAEVSIGIHSASLWPVPVNWDVGIGVFGAALSNQRLEDADQDPISMGGAYLEFGKTLSGGDYWRTWASGRAEYFGSTAFGEERTGLGGSGKLEAELYLSGVGIAPNGIFFGTYALGIFVEAAARRVSDDVNLVQIGAGLTIRTPLVWGW